MSMFVVRQARDSFEAMMLGNHVEVCGGQVVSVVVDYGPHGPVTRDPFYLSPPLPYHVFFRAENYKMVERIDKEVATSRQGNAAGS